MLYLNKESFSLAQSRGSLYSEEKQIVTFVLGQAVVEKIAGVIRCFMILLFSFDTDKVNVRIVFFEVELQIN